MFVSIILYYEAISKYLFVLFFSPLVNQKIAISILKRLGYQDVVIAGNGREALNLMRIHKFDVIFVSHNIQIVPNLTY